MSKYGFLMSKFSFKGQHFGCYIRICVLKIKICVFNVKIFASRSKFVKILGFLNRNIRLKVKICENLRFKAQNLRVFLRILVFHVFIMKFFSS